MSNEQKKTNTATIMLGAALVGVLGIAGFGMYSMTSSVAGLKNEVTELRTEVNANAQEQLSPKEFQKAVADSLEQLAQKKKQELGLAAGWVRSRRRAGARTRTCARPSRRAPS